jgi:hypothetical protein
VFELALFAKITYGIFEREKERFRNLKIIRALESRAPALDHRLVLFDKSLSVPKDATLGKPERM